MGPKTTSREPWIKRKISGENSGVLTRKQIEDYQLLKLRETLNRAVTKSRFYKRLYAGLDSDLKTLPDMAKLPFTQPEDLRETPLDFLCISQDEIARIVTLQSSGTTGNPKRLFFSGEDQELTVDFFQHGMLSLVNPGDKVLILLPGKTPGSVGDLLRAGLERAGVTAIVHGLVTSPELTREQIKRENITCLVGIPTQVLALARFAEPEGGSALNIKSVLLSTDYVPSVIVSELKRVWGCRVFNHYGMTEMGLGGGLECESFSGYHLREADLYVEIIDPVSGLPIPDGQPGEVVLTTLTRAAMPLIRYRSGDFSRFIPGPCACGTVLKRLERLKSRDRVYLTPSGYLTMADFDEALFALDNVLDFEVTLTDGPAGESRLHLAVRLKKPVSLETESRLLQAVDKIPLLRDARRDGSLKVSFNFGLTSEILAGKSPAKRRISDQRGSARNAG